MKIAFFTYTRLEYGGGVAKYFTEVTTGLMKRYKDIEIDIVTFNERSLKLLLIFYFIYFFGKQDMDKIDKEKTKVIIKKLDKVRYVKVSIFNIVKTLRSYDLIYTTNNLLEVFLLGLFIKSKNIPPVVFGFHIPMFYELADSIQSKLHNLLYSSYFYKRIIREAFRLHVMNKYDEQLLKRKWHLKNVYKIFYPFDFKKFLKNKNKKFPFKWDRKKLKIVWIGRLTEQKGVGDLLLLVKRLNNKLGEEKIYWSVFGEGELKKDIVNAQNTFGNFKYHGYVENGYIPNILYNNDVFISTSKWESFPYNLLEAQALGLPVLCFNVHGCNDIIDNRKNGYLVESVKDFENIIYNFKRKNMISRNKIIKYINNKYNYENIYKKMYSLLKK